jgi:hypothetical protein
MEWPRPLLYEAALSVSEVDRRGKGFTTLMVEWARKGHEQDVGAEAGRREEVTVSELDV